MIKQFIFQNQTISNMPSWAQRQANKGRIKHLKQTKQLKVISGTKQYIAEINDKVQLTSTGLCVIKGNLVTVNKETNDIIGVKDTKENKVKEVETF